MIYLNSKRSFRFGLFALAFLAIGFTAGLVGHQALATESNQTQSAWQVADSGAIVGGGSFKQRLANQLQLYTKEVTDRFVVGSHLLFFKIKTPSIHINPQTTQVTRFQLNWRKQIAYKVVNQPSDCTFSLFSNQPYKTVEITVNSDNHFSLPLNTSDYGRHYCLKLPIRILSSSKDSRRSRLPRVIITSASKLFVSQPITKKSVIPAYFPKDIEQAIIQDTYYDSGFPTSKRSKQHTSRELDDKFILYSHQAQGVLEIYIDKPRIQLNRSGEYSVKSFEYATVSSKTDCNRANFYSKASNYLILKEPAGSGSVFTIPDQFAQSSPYRCLKITLRVNRTGFDLHPYRFFLITPDH